MKVCKDEDEVVACLKAGQGFELDSSVAELSIIGAPLSFALLLLSLCPPTRILLRSPVLILARFSSSSSREQPR